MAGEPSGQWAQPPAYPPASPTPLSPSDERTWAMLAHLSVLLNLVTGFLGPIAALVIYLVYKDRSCYVAYQYQSMQAFVFQLIAWVGGGVLIGAAWALSGILSVVVIGLACMPFACLLSFLPLGALVYGVIGGNPVQPGPGLSLLAGGRLGARNVYGITSPAQGP